MQGCALGIAAGVAGTGLGVLAIALLPAMGIVEEGRSLLPGTALIALGLGLGVEMVHAHGGGAPPLTTSSEFFASLMATLRAQGALALARTGAEAAGRGGTPLYRRTLATSWQ